MALHILNSAPPYHKANIYYCAKKLGFNNGQKALSTAKKRVNKVIATTASLLLSHYCMAQELEPRSYTNIPIGMHFLAAGIVHSEGDLSPAPTAPISNANLNIDAGVIGYAHTFDLMGNSSKFDIAASRVCYQGDAELNGEKVSADRCGYGDPTMRLTWNFLGAPALQAKDFASWKQGLVVGTSLQITLPLGSYDKEKLLNSGSNRWVFRPGIGLSHRLGNWYYDVMASVRFYTDNKQYLVDTNLQQDPLYTVQGHLIYNLNRGHWLSLNANLFFGGETSKNTINSLDEQQNSRLGLTYSFPINQKNSIKLNASTGVITEFGNDFSTFGALWQYRF
ncbi:transporter [Shewanella sp. 1CM18E]|uniref:transporter n=1 Tax=Shewanella sp. 1CM18E TaxID=2929169 RepID=UPI0020BDF8E9|nr:transporter [Shewanella sp. 1CM18E]MCK8046477.1 transporter [Shewanella sp. 1CM18E]